MAECFPRSRVGVRMDRSARGWNVEQFDGPHYTRTYIYLVSPLLASNCLWLGFFRYITQFREIFTEEGRRQVKITHQVGEIVATFNGAHHSWNGKWKIGHISKTTSLNLKNCTCQSYVAYVINASPSSLQKILNVYNKMFQFKGEFKKLLIL